MSCMKWTAPMLYEQQLTPDQRIPQKKGESNTYVRADISVKGINHRRLIIGHQDCIWL